MERTDRAGGRAPVRLDQTWPVAIYRGARDNRPTTRRLRWDHFVRALGAPRPWDGAKIDAPAWSPVEMVEGTERRLAANVAAVSMLVLDCDNGDPLAVLRGLGDDLVRIGHTSWSHTMDYPKVRLVFPFDPSTPCPVEHWPRVWGAAARWASAQDVTVDPAAKDPSRLYFGSYRPRTERAQADARAWRDGPGPGRGFLSWAALVSTFPEPEPDLPVYASTSGSIHDSEDRHARRRRAFGHGLVRYRADQLAATGKGGRNSRLFGAARLVRQLDAAGAVDAQVALAELDAAGRASGLDANETHRTIRSGFAAGAGDPPFPIDKEMTP